MTTVWKTKGAVAKVNTYYSSTAKCIQGIRVQFGELRRMRAHAWARKRRPHGHAWLRHGRMRRTHTPMQAPSRLTC